MEDEIEVDIEENKKMHIPRKLGKYLIQYKAIEVPDCVVVESDNTETTEKIEIKCVPVRFYERCKKEVEIMSSLDHPNLLKILGSLLFPPENPRLFAIVMPKTFGDISAYQPKDDSSISENLVYKIMKDSLEGLKRIHKEKIIHRNLKLENIAVLKETVFGPDCAIRNLEYAISMDDSNITSGVGDIEYSAPETLEQEDGILKFKKECPCMFFLYKKFHSKFSFKKFVN